MYQHILYHATLSYRDIITVMTQTPLYKCSVSCQTWVITGSCCKSHTQILHTTYSINHTACQYFSFKTSVLHSGVQGLVISVQSWIWAQQTQLRPDLDNAKQKPFTESQTNGGWAAFFKAEWGKFLLLLSKTLPHNTKLFSCSDISHKSNTNIWTVWPVCGGTVIILDVDNTDWLLLHF